MPVGHASTHVAVSACRKYPAKHDVHMLVLLALHVSQPLPHPMHWPLSSLTCPSSHADRHRPEVGKRSYPGAHTSQPSTPAAVHVSHAGSQSSQRASSLLVHCAERNLPSGHVVVHGRHVPPSRNVSAGHAVQSLECGPLQRWHVESHGWQRPFRSLNCTLLHSQFRGDSLPASNSFSTPNRASDTSESRAAGSWCGTVSSNSRLLSCTLPPPSLSHEPLNAVCVSSESSNTNPPSTCICTLPPLLSMTTTMRRCSRSCGARLKNVRSSRTPGAEVSTSVAVDAARLHENTDGCTSGVEVDHSVGVTAFGVSNVTATLEEKSVDLCDVATVYEERPQLWSRVASAMLVVMSMVAVLATWYVSNSISSTDSLNRSPSVSLPHSCDNVWDDSAVWAIGGERYTVRPSTSTTTRSPCHASISTSVRRTRSSECSGSSCTNPRRPDPASSCLSPPRTRPSAPHSCTPTSPQAWALVPVQMPGAGSEKLEKATAVHVYCALHVSVPSHWK